MEVEDDEKGMMGSDWGCYYYYFYIKSLIFFHPFHPISLLPSLSWLPMQRRRSVAGGEGEVGRRGDKRWKKE